MTAQVFDLKPAGAQKPMPVFSPGVASLMPLPRCGRASNTASGEKILMTCF
jgi:hypothetical protein